jgi:hypothetical protein
MMQSTSFTADGNTRRQHQHPRSSSADTKVPLVVVMSRRSAFVRPRSRLALIGSSALATALMAATIACSSGVPATTEVGSSGPTAAGATTVLATTVLATTVVATAGATTPSSAPSVSLPSSTAAGSDGAHRPIRAAFYYGWYPEAWSQEGMMPFSQYAPSDGLYDSSDEAGIRGDIEAMRYGGMEAGIASWWGPGSPTDGRFPALLAAGRASTIRPRTRSPTTLATS